MYNVPYDTLFVILLNRCMLMTIFAANPESEPSEYWENSPRNPRSSCSFLFAFRRNWLTGCEHSSAIGNTSRRKVNRTIIPNGIPLIVEAFAVLLDERSRSGGAERSSQDGAGETSPAPVKHTKVLVEGGRPELRVGAVAGIHLNGGSRGRSSAAHIQAKGCVVGGMEDVAGARYHCLPGLRRGACAWIQNHPEPLPNRWQFQKPSSNTRPPWRSCNSRPARRR